MAYANLSASESAEVIRDIAGGRPSRYKVTHKTLGDYTFAHVYNTGDVNSDGFLDELETRVAEIVQALHEAGIIQTPSL